MCEFESLDRCAAYAAARDALEALARAVAGWPEELAGRARDAAVATVMMVAEAIAHDHATAARRRCLRDALGAAVELAACCDVARAMGLLPDGSDRSLRFAGRTVALLGLFFHANATPFLDEG